MISSKFPDLTVKHHSIAENELQVWNLMPFVYLGGAKIKRNGSWILEVQKLPLIPERIKVILSLKAHVIEMLDSGSSYRSVQSFLSGLKAFINFVDGSDKSLATPEAIETALYDYAEYQYTRYSHNKIKMSAAYLYVYFVRNIFTGAFEDVNFDLRYTRLNKTVKSQRATSREVERVMLNDASKLAAFCFDITTNFEPNNLNYGTFPIKIEIRRKFLKESINLTPSHKKNTPINKSFFYTEASHAFNNRVSAESMIFLAMTIQNISPTHSLKIEKFSFKPIGEKYEVREFKNRRGGEVLFKIPKPYRPHFERYLDFIHEYAPESKWLFPFLKKGVGYKKRIGNRAYGLKRICIKYQIPWIPPKNFRKIGENVLMRLCSDGQTTADYANHGIATFRQSYELPSLQRAMIEVGNFWNKNDPLTHGPPKVSLFNTLCSGGPEEITDLTKKIPKPDCITPTGCIGCKHYKDEDSLDYVWNLYSFKYLKIVESSSHRTKEEKPSNIAIDWANIKINWFKNSKKSKHKEWTEEAKARIEEGHYHSIWSRKIQKYKE